jgi:hypothetical protein
MREQVGDPPSTVCVVDLLLADGVDGNLLDIDLATLLCGDSNCGVGALCEHDSPGPLCVLLGAVGDGFSDILNVLGVDVVRLGEGSGLGLVADKDVDVGEDLVERVLEELGDEGSGQVEDEGLHCVSWKNSFCRSCVAYLVLSSSLLGESLDSGYADSQMETTNVVDLGVLDLLPDVLLFQVLKLVVVGGSEVGAERTVVASDDDATATSRGLLVVEVLGLDTSLLADVLEGLAVLVLTNAANVQDGLGGQDVLGAAGGVLRSTTGDEDSIVVLDQVLVQAHVLLGVGEDSVVGLEAVLLEKLLITAQGQKSSMSVLNPIFKCKLQKQGLPCPEKTRHDSRNLKSIEGLQEGCRELLQTDRASKEQLPRS